MYKYFKRLIDFLIALVAMLVIFTFVVAKINIVIDTIKNLLSGIDVDTKYIVVILKMLGITYVAEFTAAICVDAGYKSVASQVEIFAKLSLMIVGLPIVNALISLIGDSL